MRFLFSIFLLIIFALGLSFVVPSQSKECSDCPTSGALYASTFEVVDLPLATSLPPPGTLEGTLTFTRRRPAQPIVVYLVREGGELPFTAPQEKIVIGQKGARFEPSFCVALRNQEVVFKNDEAGDIDHNVYFLGAEKKDLGIFPRRTDRLHKFSQPGEVQVFCSIHSLMDGKIFVVPNPYFAVLPAKESNFKIENVPEGQWELRTYQKARRFRDVALPLTIRAGEVARKDVEMKR